jgi:hypothetical protein
MLIDLPALMELKDFHIPTLIKNYPLGGVVNFTKVLREWRRINKLDEKQPEVEKTAESKLVKYDHCVKLLIEYN